MNMIATIKHLIDKIIRDKDNNVVLMQFPNPPLIGWLIFLIIAQFVPSGFFKIGFTNLSGGLLFVWSYLEITQGSSYARRLLGAVVMISVLLGFFQT